MKIWVQSDKLSKWNDVDKLWCTILLISNNVFSIQHDTEEGFGVVVVAEIVNNYNKFCEMECTRWVLDSSVIYTYLYIIVHG
jgi:hypothetical protein